MKNRILVCTAIILFIFCQWALADVEVTDYIAYCVDHGDYVQPWFFYEITNNSNRSVYMTNDSSVTILDTAGNPILTTPITFSPHLVNPGEKCYAKGATDAGDKRIQSADQIGDYHLNIQTAENHHSITFYAPESTDFKVSGKLFGGMSIQMEAVYKNETGALQSIPEAVFVLRDETGKLVFAGWESAYGTLQPGASCTIDGYVPDYIRKFFKKNEFEPASMEVIIYQAEVI